MKIKCTPSGLLGANCYVVADEDTNKAFIVDPGGYSKKVVEYIEREGYEIEYIILTHGHGDHIGGIPEYMELYKGVKLVACEKEKEFLADPHLNMSRDCCGKELSFAADIWVNDGDTMKIGNINLRFIHTPGHTPGGMCILADDVLFSGDTLFFRSVGRTDFPGGSFSDLIDSLHDKLMKLPDETKVYPGHMGPTTIGDEKRGNPFV